MNPRKQKMRERKPLQAFRRWFYSPLVICNPPRDFIHGRNIEECVNTFPFIFFNSNIYFKRQCETYLFFRINRMKNLNLYFFVWFVLKKKKRRRGRREREKKKGKGKKKRKTKEEKNNLQENLGIIQAQCYTWAASKPYYTYYIAAAEVVNTTCLKKRNQKSFDSSSVDLHLLNLDNKSKDSSQYCTFRHVHSNSMQINEGKAKTSRA